MSRPHLGAALLMSAVLAAGAAAAETTTRTASDSSPTLQDRIEQNQKTLEAERERRRASDQLSRDLSAGKPASEAWQNYRQSRQESAAARKKTGTMFYQQQMGK